MDSQEADFYRAMDRDLDERQAEREEVESTTVDDSQEKKRPHPLVKLKVLNKSTVFHIIYY